MPRNILSQIPALHHGLTLALLTVLIPVDSAMGADTSTHEGFLPKHITGVRSFLEKHADYDGRGIRVAVLDSGVDPGAAGLQKTTQGLPKIIDILDATGSGDVDTSKTATASDAGTLEGLTGRTLKLAPDWLKQDRTFHLGKVRAADLMSGSVWNLYKQEIRKEMQATNETYKASIETALDDLESDQALSKEQKKSRKEDLEARMDLLEQMEKDFTPASPVYDCVVFKTEETWKAVVDTNSNGDLTDEVLLGEYSQEQAYASFGPDNLEHFGVHVYDEGNLLSIVVPSSPHGTHVAGMIGAYYPEAPERNGIAPGVQIVSIKIGDTHLDGMETGIALQRALRMVRDLDCDLINMSYGEPSSTPNKGWLIDQITTLVREHNVVYVASAGNAGPALSTVGAPGGTTSSILAIGAYVHRSMMPLQYGISHAPQSTLYTWSSRGPTLDGDLGVSLCAPGGAIAPVPTASMQPAMQMNGTSMASPYACGSVALILSGLKQKGLPWQSYQVRTALEDAAQVMPGIDRFSQGAGLIQVEGAFERLGKARENNGFWGYEIRNSSQSSGRGILLREQADLEVPTRHSISIEPIFHEDASTAQKAHFEVWASLESDADWIEFPDSVLIHQDRGRVSVLVDARKLGPGAYSTYIQGRDMHSATPLFRIPVHVIVPHTPENSPNHIWRHHLSLNPGDVARYFLSPPSWAQWAEFTIEGETSAPLDRLALHTTQLEPEKRFNEHEWKRYIWTEDLSEYQGSIPVTGNRTMEWTFASYWSNRSEMDLQVRIRFRGVGNFQESIVIPASDTVVPLSAQGIQNQIHLKPRGNLTGRNLSLKPTHHSIKTSMDPRDLLVDDEPLSVLELVYQWENSLEQPITPKWFGLSEVLYDSPYSSLLWRLEDEHGRLLIQDDSWADPVDVEKGPLTLTLRIWHDDQELLEAMEDMPLTLLQRLDKTIPIQIKTSLTSAASLKPGGNPWRTFDRGETENLWLFIKGQDESGQTSSDHVSAFTGNLQWLDSDQHHGATLNTSVTWIPTPSVQGPKNGTKHADSNQDLDEAIWKTSIGHLRMLGSNPSSIETFNSLYERLSKKHPFSEELDTIMLDHLDAGEITSNPTSLILHLDKMLNKIDTRTIRDHFSMRRQMKTEKDKKLNNAMKELRDTYLDLLHRKTRALALQESVSGEKTPEFQSALDELRTWTDTSEGEYRQLEIWEDQRKSSFGKALDRLVPLIREDEGDISLLNQGMALLKSIHWPYWVEQFQLRIIERFPTTDIQWQTVE